MSGLLLIPKTANASSIILTPINSRGYAEKLSPHEQWATGSLYDNVRAPLTARFWKNINIGWAGANTVFWNCEGDFLVQKPPTAQNHSLGHIGVNAVIFNTEFAFAS